MDAAHPVLPGSVITSSLWGPPASYTVKILQLFMNFFGLMVIFLAPLAYSSHRLDVSLKFFLHKDAEKALRLSVFSRVDAVEKGPLDK